MLIFIRAYSSPASFFMFFNVIPHPSVAYLRFHSHGHLFILCFQLSSSQSNLQHTFWLFVACFCLPGLSIVYCKSKGLETVLFTANHCLPYTPSIYLVHVQPQYVFIKASLWMNSSPPKATGPYITIRNTIPAKLFVSITHKSTIFVFTSTLSIYLNQAVRSLAIT